MSTALLSRVASYPDESAALLDFDTRVERSGCFRIYREVEGHIVQPRLDVKQHEVYIDRVLVPTSKLITAGWPHGPLGVEAKHGATEKNVGKTVSQALDYARAVFRIRPSAGGWYWVMLEWIFLFPFPSGGVLGSIMAQHRIGTVLPAWGMGLAFETNGVGAIRITDAGEVTARELGAGRKAGNRG